MMLWRCWKKSSISFFQDLSYEVDSWVMSHVLFDHFWTWPEWCSSRSFFKKKNDANYSDSIQALLDFSSASAALLWWPWPVRLISLHISMSLIQLCMKKSEATWHEQHNVLSRWFEVVVVSSAKEGNHCSPASLWCVECGGWQCWTRHTIQ